MKTIKYITLAAAALTFCSCNDFLDLDPQGQDTTASYMNTEKNAITQINGIYDLLGQSEGRGPDDQWMDHHYEFFFGSILSDDSEKGSKPADKTDLIDWLNWNFDGNFVDSKAFWVHGFWGVSRCNNALSGLESSTIDEAIKTRLKGEALFLRGYYYFYLLRHFGGVPLFDAPLPVSQYGNVPRATVHETLEFIIKDFDDAAKILPTRSKYAAADLGRATSGAALAFEARVLMYQAGIDAEADEAATWQKMYNCTQAIKKTHQYQLLGNFAKLFEIETKNCVESVFEIQTYENGTPDAPTSTGVAYCLFQGNRKANEGANIGWGFNNPNQDLVDAFDPTDPRLSCTVYGLGFNSGILYGQKMEYDRAQMSTNYFNRKAALSYKPVVDKSVDFDIMLMRYADVLLMDAEAAYHLNKPDIAQADLKLVRERAKGSTLCKGYAEGDNAGFPTPDTTPNIDTNTSTLTGSALLDAIWKERRLELAMENLRTWDLIRQGRYLDVVSKVKDTDRVGNGDGEEVRYTNFKANCEKHCLGTADGVKVPVPVMTIPSTEITAWNLTQNPY